MPIPLIFSKKIAKNAGELARGAVDAAETFGKKPKENKKTSKGKRKNKK